MEIKDRFTCTQCLGAFSDAFSRHIYHQSLFGKIPGKIFEPNETQTNPEH